MLKKAFPVEAKEFLLPTYLRAQYAKCNKLPPNPIELLQAFKDKDLQVRVSAAEILGQLREKAVNESVVQALMVALKDQDKSVRSQGCQGLK